MQYLPASAYPSPGLRPTSPTRAEVSLGREIGGFEMLSFISFTGNHLLYSCMLSSLIQHLQLQILLISFNYTLQ